MKSRTDIALGQPYGLWFASRNGRAAFVGLTKGEVGPTVSADEEETDEDSPAEGDPYTTDRAAAFD